MVGLPEIGERVRVWPIPGRLVQETRRPVDATGGGRFLPPAGKLVVWSEFHLELMRSGDLLLHPPPCESHIFEKDASECSKCGRDADAAKMYDETRVKKPAPAEAASKK